MGQVRNRVAFSIGCTTEGAPSVVEDYVVLHPLHSCDEVPPQQHQQAPGKKVWLWQVGWGMGSGPHPSGKRGFKPAHQAQHLPQMLLFLLRAPARAAVPAPQSSLSRRSSRLT